MDPTNKTSKLVIMTVRLQILYAEKFVEGGTNHKNI